MHVRPRRMLRSCTQGVGVRIRVWVAQLHAGVLVAVGNT